MKTLLTALRATIFGTGFILLWRRVALGLHRRYDTALGFALYIGSFIVLLGFGLFQQSIAILLFTLPWFLLAHLFVILYEEPHLRATFGEPYDSYCHPDVCIPAYRLPTLKPILQVGGPTPRSALVLGF
jgi:hypothetical protein